MRSETVIVIYSVSSSAVGWGVISVYKQAGARWRPAGRQCEPAPPGARQSLFTGSSALSLSLIVLAVGPVRDDGMSQQGSELVTKVRSRLARLGRSATSASATSDSSEDLAPKTTPKQLLRHILHKSNAVCQESNDSDTESLPRVSCSEEDSDDELRSRSRAPPLRAHTIAECLEPPDLPDNVPLESILEKLGNRIKERSDKVHKVGTQDETLLFELWLKPGDPIKRH